jgi:arylsulfatase A-like enzyme
MTQRNILLIVVDCLRADKAMAVARRPGSALAGLVARGAALTNVKVATTVTTPSFATLLTGRYSFEHGVRSLAGNCVRPELPTLPELLAKGGYHSYAFFTGPLTEETGVWRGFDEVDIRRPRRGTPKLQARFLPEPIRKRIAGRFLPTFWRDNYDPPDYLAGDWGDKLIARIRDGGLEEPWFAMVHLWEMHHLAHVPNGRMTAALFPRIGYRRALDWLDEQLARLFAALKDEDVAMVTGDHGEQLGLSPLLTFLGWPLRLPQRAYKSTSHGFQVYDWILRTPLIVRDRALRNPGRSIPWQARQVDIPATVLELAGVEPPGDWRSQSLLPQLRGDEKEHRTAFFERTDATIRPGTWLAGLHDGAWKYSFAPLNDRLRPRLINTARDPWELHNRADRESDRARRMHEELLALFGETGPTIEANEAADGDAALIDAHLRALGYC